MDEFKHNNWLIRRVIYPVVDGVTLTAASEKQHPELWPVIKSITRTELINVSHTWPSQVDIIEGIYACAKRYGEYPDVIMARFPASIMGIDIR